METTNKMDLIRDFQVPVEKLYKAWTDPGQLRAWWKPLNSQLEEVKNELIEGGAIEYKFSGAEQNFVISGKYQEVLPNEKLVYTWNWHLLHDGEEASDFKLEVTFQSSEQGSSIKISQESISEDEKIKVNQDGWEQSLEDLSTYLSEAGMKPAGTIDDHIPTVSYG